MPTGLRKRNVSADSDVKKYKNLLFTFFNLKSLAVSIKSCIFAAEIRKRTNKLFEIMNDTKDENGSNRSLFVRLFS